MSDFNLDDIISQLEKARLLPEPTLASLMLKLVEVLYQESNTLELTSPIVVVGDVHAQLFDVFELFKKAAPNGFGNTKFLFLGDYVDRGRYSICTFAYLAALKLKYPTQFFLIRGNHEIRQANQSYGLYKETCSLYGHSGIWTLFNQVFDALPIAALVDNQYFCVHGGLSPHVPLIEAISLLNRFQEVPNSGPFADLVWSDPDDVDQWCQNPRGTGYLFGKTQVEQFLHNNDIKMIVRTHQLAPEGYQWWFDNKLITVWSAPNYMYRFGNKASIFQIENGNHKIELFEPCPDDKRQIPENLPEDFYF
ncbi:Ser/Thr protein phosphatase, putative [Trichomonas vaginalis G3]|uniref:Serine/threonine-protein phosphatase n=1 Tax=Trichomonas vaginalis (strain ATCC PRA-98 / G3) TaxID=412133 RepID=A2G2Q6_TRIV3|nr:mpp pp2a pp4 pp6 domain-containing protein [Trichomonas vaginalis G3]EAX88564.1 Ser/Thr protein phosphatase, putative [Trichomonas vaginalis G3]KAI5482803.1 mpp pp2a pp4 pp6 domain-containing protein [Trichomonas vaginalis G3]|eukprot:XP_001301494.1 Ser/Thr protein phosphatase [Trichomonas vaginalis G3]